MDDFTLELIQDFITECSDLIDEIEPTLLSAPSLDHTLANNLFRPVHSLKGTSGSLGFLNITTAVHNAETLLSIFQKGDFESDDPKYKAFFLKFFDFIRNSFVILSEQSSDDACENSSKAIIDEANLLMKSIKSGEEPQIDLALEKKDVAADVEAEGPPITIDIDQDMIDAFVLESRDIFLVVEEKLLHLSKDANDRDALNEAFRNIHSFKGNCGIFSLADFEKLSHRIENILSAIIAGEIESTPAVYFAIIPIADVLKEGVEELANKDNGSKGEISGLELYLDLLDEIIKDGDNQPSTPEPTALVIEKVAPIVETVKKEPVKKVAVQPVANSNVEKAATVVAQNIRVDVSKLDILNNLVGELVTVKTMVSAHFENFNDSQMDKTFRLFDRVATDLQDVAMSIRMIPIEGVFKKMIRIVHDISLKSGKKINFESFGGETEIDKTVIEKISDPLVHMIRNAVDHGIESPADREAIGKGALGNVTLSARNEASEIWIVITDDGKGLDREVLFKKGVEKGLVAEDDKLTDNEIYNLIFSPGFSTAKEVTDVSGRGVGMDVVKTNIEDIKGRVDIQSEIGVGTIFTIKIPMTLAVIQGMILGVGQTKYILPIEMIKQSVKVEKESISHPMDDQELVNIRGEILPVVRLSHLHNIETEIVNLEDGILVVVESKRKRVAILIDKLIGQCETVVKPLPKYLSNVKGVSGCSIMGSGDASLILDVGSLIELADIKSKVGRKNNRKNDTAIINN